MTRKDYELIVAAIIDSRPAGLTIDPNPISMYEKGIKHVAHSIADALALENPRFNRDLFIKACGIED